MSKNRVNRMVALLVIILIVVAAVFFGVMRLLAPPSSPPEYTGVRPNIATDGYITHVEEIVINLPIDQYKTWSDSAPLEDLLPGASGIPRVVRTEMIQGTWNEQGARRRVVLEDGHYTAEEVLINEEGLFSYQVWDYTNFARFAVDYAVGEFRLKAIGDNVTHVTWTYSFYPQSGLIEPLLSNFVHNT